MPRNLRTIKLEIIRLRAKSPRVSYAQICIRLGILKEDGEPDTGMAKLIENGYEPRKKVTRTRLDLTARICPTCLRPMREPHEHQAKREQTPAQRWWKKLSQDRQDLIFDQFKDDFAR
jgi:hypothetical protein